MEQNLVFFLQDVMGGVSSVITNIVLHAGGNRPRATVIAYRDRREARAPIVYPAMAGPRFTKFYYDSWGKFYHTLQQLGSAVPILPATMVVTDSLELEMIQSSRLEEKVIFIVMGDFDHYYGLAKKHEAIINGFIAISQEIYNRLVTLLPHRKEAIYLAYFPTPAIHAVKSPSVPGTVRILFAGRMEEGKNPLLLPRIQDILQQKKICVQWTIAGDGPLSADLKKATVAWEGFSFTGTVSNEYLHQLYLQQDIFIMPSRLEGLPVALIEAMKTGLVPLVSNIPGGVREIVSTGVNGYLCNWNDAGEFAAAIEKLAQDPVHYNQLSAAAMETARTKFEPLTNSQHYFDIIDAVVFEKGKKKFTVTRPSRLDSHWMPGWLVKTIRSARHR